MENNDRFLPIGTVVLLKGGKKELMIISYCIVPSGEVYDKTGEIDAQDAMYDYGACMYPEGMMTSDQIFAFNHDQIEKIVFNGYKTKEQEEVSNMLNGGMALREQELISEGTPTEEQTPVEEGTPIIEKPAVVENTSYVDENQKEEPALVIEDNPVTEETQTVDVSEVTEEVPIEEENTPLIPIEPTEAELDIAYPKLDEE